MIQRCSLFILSVLLLILSSLSVAATDTVYGGVGLQVVPTVTGELVVLQVVKSSPAAAKGVLPGDLVCQVGDFSLQGSDFGKVVSEHLWGPVGSSVELTYMRPGVAGTHKVILKRSTLDPRLTVSPSVSAAPVAVK